MLPSSPGVELEAVRTQPLAQRIVGIERELNDGAALAAPNRVGAGAGA